MLKYDNDLLAANIHRALWATKTQHAFVSIRDEESGREEDAKSDLLGLLDGNAYRVYPFSESEITYPNGVSHREDPAKLGVWVSLGPISEGEQGEIKVAVRVFANHNVNFEREYSWKASPEGWVQTGKITARVR